MLRKIALFILCFMPCGAFLQCEQETGSYNSGFSEMGEHLSRSFANTECEPSTIVEGIVSAITGEYIEARTDIVLKGAEPIELQCHYAAEKNWNLMPPHGWSLNHRGYIIDAYEEDKLHSFFCDESGVALHYSLSSYRPDFNNELKLDPEVWERGITNCAHGEIGGKTNHKNTVVKVMSYNNMTATNGSGAVYSFGKKRVLRDISHVYPLTRIKKANGNTIEYCYEKDRLGRIKTYNASGDLLNELRIKHFSPGQIDVTSLDGRKVHYASSKEPDGSLRYEVLPNFSRPLTYIYSKKDKINGYKILRKEEPNGRYLEIDYYKKGQALEDDAEPVKSKDDPRYDRVRLIRKPVGTDATPVVTHRFVYDIHDRGCAAHRHLLGGSTAVFDAYGHKVRYYYSDEHRLTRFERYTGQKNHQLYSLEKFYWGADASDNSGQLISKTHESPDGRILSCRHFRYDSRGNVLQELWLGNLTGTNFNTIVINSEGIPQPNDNEYYQKNYRYSNDGLNLKTFESDSQHAIAYRYVEGTDLLQKKLLKSGNSVRIRNFYEYDANGILTREIIDDGSDEDLESLAGVTERRIKNIRNRSTLPIGLPELTEEGYLDLDSGEFILLHKTVNDYDIQGNLIRQEHYDNQSELAYTLAWEYDTFGHVIKETNALGQVIERKYDLNGNKIFEQGPCLDFYTNYHYDYSNRLIKTEKVDSQGRVYTNTFTYDYLNHLIRSSDYYGNETSHEYDALGRLVRTVFPEVAYVDGNISRPGIRQEYDLLGNIIMYEDAEGRKTCKKYNLRGQPLEIMYPDGTTERYEYAINGNPVKSIAKNGTYAVYTYDYQSRLVQTDHYSAGHKLLSSTSAVYNAFHLIEETDSEGIKTHYKYDRAGRMVSAEKGAQKHTCHYDSLGHLCEVHEYFGYGVKDYVVKKSAHDALDRPLSESIEDADGSLETKVQYVYDALGRKTATIHNSREGLAISQTSFDILGHILEETDPLGCKTVYRYPEDCYNSLGQNVECIETTDPLGRTTVSIKDALGRTVCTLLKTPLGEMIHQKEISYTLSGLPVRQLDSEAGKQVITQWEYDGWGRLISLIEAASTPEQKNTHYSYNEYGLQDRIIKPDGTVLFTLYDIQNRVRKRYSSDETIDYSYTCNNKGMVVKIQDNIRKCTTQKCYDVNDNLISETLGHEAELQYEYDRLGRIKKITLPDRSGIAYHYQGSFLREVQRTNTAEKVQYTHCYVEYDLSGNCLASELIHDGGTLAKQYNLAGCNTRIDSVFWKETIQKYDSVGNILKKCIEDALGKTWCQYSYDHQNQLKTEKGEFSGSYTYDSFHNRTSKNGDSCNHNALNQILSDQDSAYYYDANGRMVRKSTQQDDIIFYYDALDRLICIIQNNQKIQFIYDAEDRRLEKHVMKRASPGKPWTSISQSRYLYANLNEIGSTDSKGSIRELRVLGLGLGAEIGAAVAIEIDNRVYTPVHDTHGNVRALIDSRSKKVVETYRFSAFGEEVIYDGEGNPLMASINPWRFSSKRADPETGFIYYGHRYYDPSLGRWITPDPIGFEGGPNLYAFVSNNPLKNIDLYGLIEESASGAKEPESRSIIVRAIQAVGRVVKAIGDYLIPIPGIRDAISYIGHRLSGRSHESYERHGFTGRFHAFDLGKKELNPKESFVFSGGMLTCVSDGEKAGEQLSQFHDNANVHCAIKTSSGPLFDLLEFVIMKAGGKTARVKGMIEMTRQRIKALGGTASGGLVKVEGHSLAGLAIHCMLKYLTPEEKKMLAIVTYGTAHIVSGKGVHSAINHVSPRDWISILAHPTAHVKNLFYKDKNIRINYVPSRGFPFIDHFLNGRTYRQAMMMEHKI